MAPSAGDRPNRNRFAAILVGLGKQPPGRSKTNRRRQLRIIDFDRAHPRALKNEVRATWNFEQSSLVRLCDNFDGGSR